MAIREVRLPDGTAVVIDEWLDWPQYSTVEFAAGAQLNKFQAFSYVVGQRVPQVGAVTGGARNATDADTNQVASGRMNQDESYLVYSLTYDIFGLTNSVIEDASPTPIPVTFAPAVRAQNIRRLQRDVVVELLIGAGITKPMLRYTFAWIGQGPGAKPYGSGAAAAADAPTFYNVGSASCYGPAPQAQRTLALPIYVHNDRRFALQMTSYPGAMTDLDQDIRLRWHVSGLKRRPVA